MNRKIVLTMGVFVLAAAGVFAHAKKAVSTAIYAKVGAACVPIITIPGGVPSAFTSNSGAGSFLQASIKSTGGVTRSLWSTSTCASNKVYFKS
jgi:hypothetical protein